MDIKVLQLNDQTVIVRDVSVVMANGQVVWSAAPPKFKVGDRVHVVKGPCHSGDHKGAMGVVECVAGHSEGYEYAVRLDRPRSSARGAVGQSSFTGEKVNIPAEVGAWIPEQCLEPRRFVFGDTVKHGSKTLRFVRYEYEQSTLGLFIDDLDHFERIDVATLN